MADDVKARLPKTPIHKMWLDGGQTRKIIAWIKKMEGDVDGVDIDDPELRALLLNFSERIASLETFTNNLPNIQAAINRITTLENTSAEQQAQLSTAVQNLTNLIDRVIVLESQTPVDPATIAQLNSKVIELETAIQQLNLLIMDIDIQPIPNAIIAAIFD